MKNLRVLIANDNPQMLQLFSNLLSDEFCIVGTVSDEKALIAAVLALHPHIIITNFDLPAMTGLIAVRRFQTFTPDTNVILFADHEEPEWAPATMSAGALAFPETKEALELAGRIGEFIRDLLISHPNRFMGEAFPHTVHTDGRALIEKGESAYFCSPSS